jgi:hypothetical protein
MHLYDCRFDVFVPQATSGQIADVLASRFSQRLDHAPSESEVKSWRNSLGAFAEAVADGRADNSWIVLEYQLPLASTRIDCMLLGADAKLHSNAVLVELKQWDACVRTSIPETVRVGVADLLHPSAQVRNYREYLQDTHSAFSEGAAFLHSCAFLHNLHHAKASGFFDSAYAGLLEDSPIFSADDVDELSEFVSGRIDAGAKPALVDAVLNGRYLPSRKLLDSVADAIAGHEPWHLLDEQQLVFNRIMADIEYARTTHQDRVIVVKGGPGTGKSVIAVQVVGAAARKGYSVAHATGSKAFTTNLRGIVGKHSLFTYFNQFSRAERGSIDLIVCDEAHRLRETSASFYGRGSGRPQVDEVIEAGKVCVFLLDEHQSVRSNEVGSVNLITEHAIKAKRDLASYDLDTQFRCAGSESYVRWVEYLLGISKNRSMAWRTQNEYDVRVFSDVRDMEAALQSLRTNGATARMVAGFCWPWSDPLDNGALVRDVQIGDWARPWNRKPRDMWHRKGSAESPRNHPYTKWANTEQGFGEIGCIYSAQGFEFDYVGVIFGGDLAWDPLLRRWRANLRNSDDAGFKRGLDEETATEKLKQVYRVLSTRGMKGTFFYFCDQASEAHVRHEASV